MNLRALFLLSCTTTAALSLSACSSIKIKDFEICADMGSQGATCDYFLPPAEPHDIQKNEWDDKRFGEFCISSNDFGDLKKEIEQLCSLNSASCNYETRAAIADFFNRMARLKKSK